MPQALLPRQALLPMEQDSTTYKRIIKDGPTVAYMIIGRVSVLIFGLIPLLQSAEKGAHNDSIVISIV
jgi:hypothetical protein